MIVAELIGVALIVYGIWFGARGVRMQTGTSKEWWRPLQSRQRYPYPIAGILLGAFFVLLGGRFALDYSWDHAPLLGYIGAGLFVIVLVLGVAQPRALHPKWYGQLEDRLGKKALASLRSAALRLETEAWIEIASSQERFDEWVNENAPWSGRTSRGYQPTSRKP